MNLFSHLVSITLALLHSTASAVDVPVIGIVSRENFIPGHETDGDNYIAASYAKWLESAGARSIAIFANTTEEEVDIIFQQINGLLMPGGNSAGPQAERRLYQLAKEANENGDTFPIVGICWGFQSFLLFERDMLRIDSEDVIPIHMFDAEDLIVPLEFTQYGATQSAIFDPEMQELFSKPIAYNHHTGGVLAEPFKADPAINDMFEITSINHDRKGKEFVSSLEARDFDTYPFFGFQWHPEKVSFEYGTNDGTDDPINPNLTHNKDGTLGAQRMAAKFVELARKNAHVYTEFERWPIIWEYPQFRSPYFEQFFVIDELVARTKISNHTMAKKSMLRGGTKIDE